MRIIFAKTAALLMLWTLACSEPQRPDGAPLQSPGAEPPASAEQLHFTAPEGWIQETPSSPMRRVQYRLPGAPVGSEDADLAIFVFPGTGGGVDANLERWVQQFSNPDGSPATEQAEIRRTEVGGMRVSMLDISGTYDPGVMAGGTGAQQNFRMLAAVVEAPADPWFIKLTGPIPTIDYWERSFHEFVESFHLSH